MLVLASLPQAFAGLDTLQSRPSAEEQYLLAVAEEHERAAAAARQQLHHAQLSNRAQCRQQRDAFAAQRRLQQQLAASLRARTPQRSPYHAPNRHLARLPVSDLLQFDAEDYDSCDAYAERMHRHTQQRQQRAREQAILQALVEEQRREQAQRSVDRHRQRVEEAKAEAQRQAQRASDQHLAARVAEEQRLREAFQALLGSMNTSTEPQGADLERQNAIRRSSVPAKTEASTSTPASVPVPPVRSASPAPSASSVASDASLHSISQLQQKYDSLRSSFTLPSNLVFAPTSSSPAASPTLLYNSTNAPVHAYEHALTSLLTELDGVESFGEERVRDVRRTLARSVEAELAKLEEAKKEAWRTQQDVAPAVVADSIPAESVTIPAEPEAISSESPVVEEPTVAEPATPFASLSTRLAQGSEDEDPEVKAVRENLLARLTSSATDPEPTPIPAAEVVDRVQSAEPTIEESTQTAPVEEFSPVVELVEPPAVVEPSEAVEEPNVASEHTEELIAEPAPAEVEPASPEPASAHPEVAPVLTPEPEVEAEHSTQLFTKQTPETESATTTTEAASDPVVTPEPESTPVSEPVSPASLASELEVVAPVHEADNAATFVRIFPDSESDSGAETDADMASELADGKSDEFEML